MNKIIALLNCHEDDVVCFRKEIIDNLIENGYIVLLSCPIGNRLRCFKDNPNIIIEDIKIDRRGTNPLKDLKLLFAYKSLFRKYRPDVVCSFTIKPNIYGSIAAKQLNIPYINNITGLGSGFQNGGIVKKVIKLLYKISLRKSKMVFFQNKENMETALKCKLISKKINYQCIPGSGVNLNRFIFTEKEKNDNVIFNYIGRVLKDKRIDDYLSVASIIKKRYDNCEFNVIGFIEPTEIYYKELLNKLESEGIICYRGSVEDIKPFIIRADAIIHPSSYGEGMSNVLLETAASGRAIITTDISGCRETVDEGISGYVYHAEDVENLVHVVEKFISLSFEEKCAMGLAGRKKVENEFDRNIVVKKYEDTIKEILETRI